MKISKLFFLLSLFPSIAGASECFLYEMKGVVKINFDRVELILHERTLSQRALLFHEDLHLKTAPYNGKIVEGTFIKSGKSSAITGIRSLRISTPDPLNQKNHSYEKLTGKIPCP